MESEVKNSPESTEKKSKKRTPKNGKLRKKFSGSVKIGKREIKKYTIADRLKSDNKWTKLASTDKNTPLKKLLREEASRKEKERKKAKKAAEKRAREILTVDDTYKKYISIAEKMLPEKRPAPVRPVTIQDFPKEIQAQRVAFRRALMADVRRSVGETGPSQSELDLLANETIGFGYIRSRRSKFGITGGISGETILHKAILQGYLPTIENILLSENKRGTVDSGRSLINAANRNGWSALHYACCVKYHSRELGTSILRLLLDHGANVHQQIEISLSPLVRSGSTPLHLAAAAGLYDYVDILIEKGQAVVDSLDAEQWTPLMLAAFHGHTKVVRSLMDSGADHLLQNIDLMDAEMLAKDEVSRLIRSIAPKKKYGHRWKAHRTAVLGNESLDHMSPLSPQFSPKAKRKVSRRRSSLFIVDKLATKNGLKFRK
eukprot:g532.t1